jgi:drug/metabolite transporter (DMT)-like permease
MFAIVWSGNPGYAVALINTHAIITALYGVFILKEKVTKRKIFVFCCMILALLAFAFA